MVKKKSAPKLGKRDWLEMGLKVLVESGVEAVRVEPLAKMLKVTKGSFYWHFKNRGQLLEAILQDWVARETSHIIEYVEGQEGDAKAKLLHLFERALQDDGDAENAVRAWATQDAEVAAIIAEVDRRRLAYTQDLFVAVGFSEFEALVRAKMVYYALLGEFMVSTPTEMADRLAEVQVQHKILTRQD